MALNKKKLTIAGIAVSVVCLLIGLIVTLTLVLKKDNSCQTQVCKDTADRLLYYMNDKIDPCTDFYNFACGRYMRLTNLPQTGSWVSGPFVQAIIYLRENVKGILRNHRISGKAGSAADKAVLFYRDCINAAKYSPSENRKLIKDLLKELMNGCPLIPDTVSSPETFSWSQSVAKIIRNLDQNFVFNLHILPHPKNASQQTITLFAESTDEVRSVIRPPLRSRPVQYSTDRSTIEKVICVIDENCHKNTNLSDDINTLVEKYPSRLLYSLYDQDASPPNYGSPKTIKAPNGDLMSIDSLTIRQLQASVPEVEWKEFFSTAFNDTDYKVNDDTVVVTSPGFLKVIIDMFFTNRPPRHIAMFLGWRLILKYGPVLFQDIAYLLNQSPQEDICRDLTESTMGFAVGHLYHKKFVTEDTVKEASNIIGDLKMAFQELLHENSWMDSETKHGAFAKIKNMVESVSTPDFAVNEKDIDKYYEKIFSRPQNTYQESFRQILRFGMYKQASLLNEPLDRRNNWPVSTSAETNAFYYQNTNAMMFPSGILSYPFYEAGRPSAMNYGAFGYIAGHEVTHGFDNTGSLRDQHGTIFDWWSTDSRQKFEKSSKCFVEQYGKIFDITAGKFLNGENTLEENIADNGGIREAYRAFKNHQVNKTEEERLPGLTKYNHDQLFFLSAAHMYCTQTSPSFLVDQIKNDVHSPNKYRITVPFQNSEDFAKAYGCSKGKTMNPEQKCIIW